MKIETVNVDLKFNITRELEDNEVLCPVCAGTSLHIKGIPLAEVTNGTYELKKFAKFDTIVGCNSCYFGKQKKCKHCSKLLGRSSTCGCEGEVFERREKQLRKEHEQLEKAIKLKRDDEIAKGMGMYYFNGYPYNEGYFADIEEFIEWWNEEHEDVEPKPTYVWGTKTINLSLDAGSILENACDDLHEEAYPNLSGIDELQRFLNEWCEKQSGTTTYYEDNKYAIEIAW